MSAAERVPRRGRPKAGAACLQGRADLRAPQHSDPPEGRDSPYYKY
ncbi:hypothetical protein SGRA_2871 [Saprospira grandis str. Lewin]|uniref:Uncharacterized protein n=1 Tax=Saprospira grandis (strain Lewin) TaxID=984262 RepID=H6LAK6_SAPGL|nr:hypothetical protein SGRA_2871 [Saprospira grandis str. Lewin]